MKPRTLTDGVLTMMPDCDVGGAGGWSEVKGRSEVTKERGKAREKE